MDPPQSSASSIIVSDHPSADIGEPQALDIPPDRALSPRSAWLAVERDDVFYFETITFQVRCKFILPTRFG